jgi:hypothetical protein
MSCPGTVTDALLNITTQTTGTAVSSYAPNIPRYGTTPGCILPTGYVSIVATIPSNAARDTATNLLTSSAIQSIMPSLNVCNPTSIIGAADISACVIKDATFISGVNGEYNYYYALYSYAIGQLITALTNPTSLTGWALPANAVTTYQAVAVRLNQHVNDIISVIDTIAQSRRTTNIPVLTQKINAFDASLQQQAAALQKQQAILSQSSQNQMLLMKEMETYSRNKAKYHNNMLMLYSFLNITALGLLFYVYRSM